MPKIKTRRSLRRRFRMTAGGKVRIASGFRRHLLGHKSSNRKRRLRRPQLLTPLAAKKIKRLLPYQ